MEQTSMAASESGAAGASNLVRLTALGCKSFLIARTCAAYGETIPISHAKTSCSAINFFTSVTTFCASIVFICEAPSDRSSPSGQSTNANGTAGTGQSNPCGARLCEGGVPESNSLL